MSRHPLMYAMAMEAFTDDLGLYEHVEHWLAIEEKFANDLKVDPIFVCQPSYHFFTRWLDVGLS